MRNKIVIISISLLLFAIAFNFLLPKFYTPILSEDGVYYNGIALALQKGEQYIDTPGYFRNGYDIGEMIMPGYPFLMSIIFKIFGNSHYPVITLQVILWLISLFVLKEIAFEFTQSKKFSYILPLLYISHFPLLPYHGLILIESVTFSFLIFSLYYAQRFFKSFQKIDLIIFSAFYGVLFACNNRFAFHLPVFGLVFLIAYLREKKFKLKIALPAIIIFIAVLLPWHARQYSIYGTPVIFGPLISQSFGMARDVEIPIKPNLIQDSITVSPVYFAVNRDSVSQIVNNHRLYIYDYVLDMHLERYPNVNIRKESKEEFSKKFTPEKHRELNDKMAQTSYSPLNTKIGYFVGFFEVYRPDYRYHFGNENSRIELPSFYDEPFGKGAIFWWSDFSDLFVLGFGFIFALIGFVISIIKREYFIQICGLLVLSHNFLHALAGYMPRYRLTILSAVFIAATYGLWQLIKTFNKKTKDV